MQLDPLQPVIPNIVRGEDLVFPVQLPNDEFSGDPVDLTAASEITMTILNQDATALTYSFTGGKIAKVNAQLSRFNILFAAADTALLKISAAPGDQAMRVTYTIAGKITIVNLTNFFTVTDKLFPGL